MPVAGYYQISNGHTALLRAAYCGWWLTPYIVLRSATYFADQVYTGSVTDKNNRYLPVISHNARGLSPLRHNRRVMKRSSKVSQTRNNIPNTLKMRSYRVRSVQTPSHHHYNLPRPKNEIHLYFWYPASFSNPPTIDF